MTILLLALLSAGLETSTAAAAPATSAPLPTALAALAPTGGSGVSGSAKLKGFPTTHNAWVQVTAKGLPAASRTPWQIRQGTCEALGSVVYHSSQAKALRANTLGRAVATIIVPTNAMLFGFHALTINGQACGQIVVAGGLDNARGLAWGPNRALYIAEAGIGGSGPCVTVDGGVGCYGASGAVTRVIGGVQQRVTTRLPSLAMPGGAGAGGPHGIAFRGSQGYLSIGGQDFPSLPAGVVGNLHTFRLNGTTQIKASIAAYEAANNPDGAANESNAYGIAAGPTGVAVADAAGNSLLLVSPSGAVSTLAVFPHGPGGWQAVPTSVALGPDGAWYVGQLTGFPFPVGGANIYRVPANGGTPTVHKSGFTNIVGIAFGLDGSLYVVEFATNGILSGDTTGALKKIAPSGGAVTTIASTGLIAPGGVAVGPDGNVYVTNLSVAPGAGHVLRFKP
jgi:hypothetical protein